MYSLIEKRFHKSLASNLKTYMLQSMMIVDDLMIKKDDKRNDLSADNNVEKLDLYLEQKLKSTLLSQPFLLSLSINIL